MIHSPRLAPHLVVAALAAMLVACNDGEPRPAAEVATVDTADAPAATTDPAPDDPAPDSTLLTPDGWGPLRIGMTRAEIVAAAGEDANPDAVGGPNPEECDEFRPTSAPQGVLVMLEDGVLTRISVSRNTNITTPVGIRVGDPASRVLEEYGSRARVELHKYSEPPAQYITVWRDSAAGAERRGIRYEIGGDGNVAHLRGGGPSIAYVEGCL